MNKTLNFNVTVNITVEGEDSELVLVDYHKLLDAFSAGRSKVENAKLIPDALTEFGLSERESQIMSAFVNGECNSEIADKLFISISTVKYHTKNLFQKLGVKNRFQAINKIHNQFKDIRPYVLLALILWFNM